MFTSMYALSPAASALRVVCDDPFASVNVIGPTARFAVDEFDPQPEAARRQDAATSADPAQLAKPNLRQPENFLEIHVRIKACIAVFSFRD
jgi:hypothetical protein